MIRYLKVSNHKWLIDDRVLRPTMSIFKVSPFSSSMCPVQSHQGWTPIHCSLGNTRSTSGESCQTITGLKYWVMGQIVVLQNCLILSSIQGEYESQPKSYEIMITVSSVGGSKPALLIRSLPTYLFTIHDVITVCIQTRFRFRILYQSPQGISLNGGVTGPVIRHISQYE